MQKFSIRIGSLLVLTKYDIIKSTPSEQPTHILRILKMTQYWHEPKTWQIIQILFLFSVLFIITFYIGIKCEFDDQTLNEIEMSGNDRTLDRGKGTVVP